MGLYKKTGKLKLWFGLGGGIISILLAFALYNGNYLSQAKDHKQADSHAFYHNNGNFRVGEKFLLSALKNTAWINKSGVIAPPKTENKSLVIDCWATWCSPCIKALPHFEALAAQYSSNGLSFMTIAPQKLTPVSEFLHKNEFQFPVALDVSGVLCESLGVIALPAALIIDPTGTIVWRGRTNDLTASMLENYIAKGTIPPSMSKPYSIAFSYPDTTKKLEENKISAFTDKLELKNCSIANALAYALDCSPKRIFVPEKLATVKVSALVQSEELFLNELKKTLIQHICKYYRVNIYDTVVQSRCWSLHIQDSTRLWAYNSATSANSEECNSSSYILDKYWHGNCVAADQIANMLEKQFNILVVHRIDTQNKYNISFPIGDTSSTFTILRERYGLAISQENKPYNGFVLRSP